MAKKIIEVDGLVKIFDGTRTVLDDISFNLESGEFVVVYGKSGCGKTTLLNVLGGLDRPDSGRIQIDGNDIVGMTEDELAGFRLRNIGFVFQDFNLLPDLTVRENVALPLRFSGDKDRGRLNDLLAMFDIEQIADATANKISGGEAQRTAIARAMMNKPKIIMADEPTGNLDTENAANVIEMFEFVRRDFGTTIILATHDKSLVAGTTSRIRLSDGKAFVEGAG